jgi:hypothetical protein
MELKSSPGKLRAALFNLVFQGSYEHIPLGNPLLWHYILFVERQYKVGVYNTTYANTERKFERGKKHQHSGHNH